MPATIKKLGRVVKWIRKPTKEKAASLRRRILSVMPPSGTQSKFLFLAYQPDSHADFGAHPEFADLFLRFTKFNKAAAPDSARLWSFILNIKQVLAESIPGDFAEVGVYKGNTAAVLAHYAAANGRVAYLFDTFEGFDSRDLRDLDAHVRQEFTDTSVSIVKSVVGPEKHNSVSYIRGYFPDTITAEHQDRCYAVVSIDCDLYAPARAGLEFFYPRMAQGGLLLLHDYSSLHWAGLRRAIDEFCRSTGEHVVLIPDKSGTAIIRKTTATKPFG